MPTNKRRTSSIGKGKQPAKVNKRLEETSDEDSENDYEVDFIFVRWKGYDSSEDTHLFSLARAIGNFNYLGPIFKFLNGCPKGYEKEYREYIKAEREREKNGDDEDEEEIIPFLLQEEWYTRAPRSGKKASGSALKKGPDADDSEDEDQPLKSVKVVTVVGQEKILHADDSETEDYIGRRRAAESDDEVEDSRYHFLFQALVQKTRKRMGMTSSTINRHVEIEQPVARSSGRSKFTSNHKTIPLKYQGLECWDDVVEKVLVSFGSEIVDDPTLPAVVQKEKSLEVTIWWRNAEGIITKLPLYNCREKLKNKLIDFFLSKLNRSSGR
ncbi:hypothetical protein BC829DRAFT_394960 [Chytridium lagenaria]|nr:hypothetical protein BC829DRAFT_394960 [Chytridium lagenaria]